MTALLGCQAGVQQAFASDWPVVLSDPILGMFAASFRKNPGVAEAFIPEEQVSLLDSMKASTLQGAKLAGVEDRFGTLK